MNGQVCETWADHQWGGHRFVEVGRHPTMGHFQKLLVRCERCGRETTETRWMDLPHVALPAGPNLATCSGE